MRHLILVLICWFAALLAVPTPARADEEDSYRFEGFRRLASLGYEPVLTHIFGDDSILAAIDSLPPDRALRFDLNGDGKIDCLAYRDGEARVAVLDDRGDFGPNEVRGDMHDDCYLVDADRDGVPERIVDYHDTDGDGGADREDLYEIFPGAIREGAYVLVYFDLDHDGRMLHLTNYGYHANRDEWESDFDGDTCFLAGRRDESTGAWTSCDENPFCFYDDDHDGHSDEAVRLEGKDLSIHSLRWSFDADGDTPAKGAPDYDFSITAVGSVTAPAAFADSVILRDGRALRFVSWAHARDLARWGLWKSALLVWDEEDSNVAPQSEVPDRPRWEGVIADALPPFPAVGGPGCGRVNKRYELAPSLTRPLGIYFSTVDERIHLRDAASGEIAVSLPGDKKVERTIAMRDESGNGYFDSWTYAAGGSPAPAPPGKQSGASGEAGTATPPRAGRSVKFLNEGVRSLPLDATAIRRFWKGALSAARDHDALDEGVLEHSIQRNEPTAMRRWRMDAMDRNDPLAARAERSVEADRFLRDLTLWDMGGGFLARGANEGPVAGASFTVARPHGGPFEIGFDRIPEDARKPLNPAAASELVTSATHVSGQVEDDRIWFPTSSRGKATLEIDPTSPLPFREWIRTDPWFGRGIAFENRAIAYRTYYGHLDLFVKNEPAFVLRGSLGDYHHMQPWGMDALEIGDGPGIGDLYILGDSKTGWVPLFGPGRDREERLAAGGPLRARIETILASPDTTILIGRTLTLASSDTYVIEKLTLVRSTKRTVTLAAALPPLTDSGALADSAGIWSFGVSVPEAGAIGLAGMRISGGRGPGITRIHDAPAIRFEIAAGDTIRFSWIAGGRAYGDTTAVGWKGRAEKILK